MKKEFENLVGLSIKGEERGKLAFSKLLCEENQNRWFKIHGWATNFKNYANILSFNYTKKSKEIK